jgi:hypothetical protein
VRTITLGDSDDDDDETNALDFRVAFGRRAAPSAGRAPASTPAAATGNGSALAAWPSSGRLVGLTSSSSSSSAAAAAAAAVAAAAAAAAVRAAAPASSGVANGWFADDDSDDGADARAALSRPSALSNGSLLQPSAGARVTTTYGTRCVCVCVCVCVVARSVARLG